MPRTNRIDRAAARSAQAPARILYRAVLSAGAFGAAHAAFTVRGLCALTLPGWGPLTIAPWQRNGYALAELAEAADPVQEQGEALSAALMRYAAGQHEDFALAIDDAVLPDFHRRAYRALRGIAFGTTLSYAALAVRAGSPRAARAIGQAMARNPLPIVVPCHRVLATNGLGGFTGGLAWKRRLLALEGQSAIP